MVRLEARRRLRERISSPEWALGEVNSSRSEWSFASSNSNLNRPNYESVRALFQSDLSKESSFFFQIMRPNYESVRALFQSDLSKESSFFFHTKTARLLDACGQTTPESEILSYSSTAG